MHLTFYFGVKGFPPAAKFDKFPKSGGASRVLKL